MAYEVLRTRSFAATVASLTNVERHAYEAAVQSLRGEGCRAGGKRLLAIDGGDVALCQRSLYGAWRMTIAFLDDNCIVIIALGRHTTRENPNRVLAELFPDLSPTGRRRSDQPPCCDDPASPPVLGDGARHLLGL